MKNDDAAPDIDPDGDVIAQHTEYVERRKVRTGSGTARRGLPEFLIISAGLAFSWIAIQGIQSLQDVIAPSFMALNLVIVAYPIQTVLRRMGLPRWLATLASGITILVAATAFVWALGWSIASLITELPSYSGKLNDMYNQSLKWLVGMGVSQDKLNQMLRDINPTSLLGYATTALTSVQSALSLLTVILMVTFFMLIDSVGFTHRLATAAQVRPGMAGALVAFGKGVRSYWVVSTVFGLIVAVLNGIGLVWLGVPLAFVWAMLSFLTNYLPNVGFVIGLVPAALMALLANGPSTALWVVVMYCGINFVIQSGIQPKFAGEAVGVTGTVSFLSLLFWAWVMGPLGALLALPATLLVKAVLVDSDPNARWVNAFIASDPTTAKAETTMEAHAPEHATEAGKDTLPTDVETEAAETSPAKPPKPGNEPKPDETD